MPWPVRSTSAPCGFCERHGRATSSPTIQAVALYDYTTGSDLRGGSFREPSAGGSVAICIGRRVIVDRRRRIIDGRR
jgi:hypothetical protein